MKKVILKISKKSQENTYVEVSLLINLKTVTLQLYSRSDSGTGIFFQIFRNF